MKIQLNLRAAFLVPLVLLLSCDKYAMDRRDMESFTFGQFRLYKIVDVDGSTIVSDNPGYREVYYRKYISYDVDSILLYRDGLRVAARAVKLTLAKDVRKKKMVYQMNDGTFLRMIWLGDKSGILGNNGAVELSEFVTSEGDFDKSKRFYYEAIPQSDWIK